MSWRALVALLVAVASLGCGGTGQPSPTGATPTAVPGMPFDFTGEVVAVEFADDWHMSPDGVALATGGGDVTVTIGPQTLVLRDGRRLQVPAHTPGGNWCLVLIHPSQVTAITGQSGLTVADVPRWATNHDWGQPCVVAGGLVGDDTVTWYLVLPVVDHQGTLLADVGGVVAPPNDGVITTFAGHRIPTTVTETTCGAPIGATAGTKALLDWTTGEVVALVCLFSG